MFDIAQIFATQPLLNGENIAIITASGSLGSLACDQIEKFGLTLASLKTSTIEKMKKDSPNWTSVRNPVDLGPSVFSTFETALTALMNDENVNAVLYIFAVPQKPLETFSLTMIPQFRLINKLVNQFEKPVTVCVFGSRWTLDYLLEESTKYSIPVMTRTDHAIKGLKMMYDFKTTKNQ
jgi:acetyltransferase